jgi:hypothetical protein
MVRFFLPFMTAMLIEDSLTRLPGSAHAVVFGTFAHTLYTTRLIAESPKTGSVDFTDVSLRGVRDSVSTCTAQIVSTMGANEASIYLFPAQEGPSRQRKISSPN